MNNQARIIALKLAAKILIDVGMDGVPLEGHMSLELLAERNKLGQKDDVGAEWESIILKINDAIRVLEDPNTEFVNNDDVRLDA